MALPGTHGQRISDLCSGKHITQKELTEKIGVSASHLSRIVSGETKTVSSNILIDVAKGIMARNQLIEMATAPLSDLMKDQPGEAVTAAMFQTMQDILAEQKQNPLSVDDVTAVIAGQTEQLVPMDEEPADLLQRLVKKIIEQRKNKENII